MNKIAKTQKILWTAQYGVKRETKARHEFHDMKKVPIWNQKKYFFEFKKF